MDFSKGQVIVYVQDDIVHVGTIGKIIAVHSLFAIEETGRLIHVSHVLPNAQIHIKGGA